MNVRPNGDKVLTSEAFFYANGYHIAENANGERYVCGHRPVLTQHPDGTATFAETMHGKRRVWHRDAAERGRGRWTEDLTADAQRYAAQEVPASLQGGTRWRVCDNGKPFDGEGARRPVLTTCQGWASEYRRGQAGNLWLCGEPGRGKSQLVAWLVLDLADAGVRALHVEWTVYVATVQAGYGGDAWHAAESERMQRMAREATVLVLDDLGAGKVTDDASRLAFDLLQARSRSRAPWIVTSNLTPDGMELRGWDPRVASRCRDAQLLALTGPDYRAQATLAGVA